MRKNLTISYHKQICYSHFENVYVSDGNHKNIGKKKFHFCARTASNPFLQANSFGEDGGFLTPNNSKLAQSQIFLSSM
jgi:hypothetical protein